MKAITFLGTGTYESTTYYHAEFAYQTNLFPEAVARWWHPESMIVFLTAEARSHKNWSELQKRIGSLTKLDPIDIPSGRSEVELWEIFDRIARSLDQGDKIVFDITHAFRSLPLIALLVASFLRTTRGLHLLALLYGAFEAKDKLTNRTPVFDLTRFLDLLDWMAATRQFLDLGDGEPLAKLLHPAGEEANALATNIRGISEGLRLLRPVTVQIKAAQLGAALEHALPALKRQAPPFIELMEHVRQSYQPLGLVDPLDPANARESLVRQLRMIRWYLDRQLLVQAVSLAREWMPSLLCLHFNCDPFNYDDRSDMELLLAGGKEEKSNRESHRRKEFKLVPEGKRLRNLWSNPPFTVAHLRNDVLHAGYRKNPTEAGDIGRIVETIVNELEDIARIWGLHCTNAG